MRWLFVLVFSLSQAWAAPLTKEQRKELFEGATKRLKETKIEKRAPQVGEKFPDLVIGGKKVSEWTKDAPMVLTFYRGGWCPYCVKQLKELSQNLKEFHPAAVIAVSPETQQEVDKTRKKNDLKVVLVADKSNELARSLGLAFKVEDAVAQEYKALGLDLQASQGNADNILPVPATFVIGRDLKVAYMFADADYTKRAAMPDIVKSVERVLKP